MHQGFSTSLTAVSDLEILIREDAVSDDRLRETYSLHIAGIVPLLEADDKCRLFFRRVPEKRLSSMVNEVLNHACSDGFRGEDLEPLLRKITHEKSFPRLLLFLKMLEELSIRSTNEQVWRVAMNTLAEPLYGPVKAELSGTSKEAACSACLKNIYSTCEGRKKQFASEIIGYGHKMDFYTDIVCGALFTDRQDLERRMAGAVLGLDGQTVMAALAVHQMSRIKPPPALFQKLIGIGRECAGSKEGIAHMMSIIGRGGSSSGMTEVYMAVIDGLRQILTTRPLPHPWFRAEPGESGIPVPTFEKDGIHMNSFAVLEKLPSGPSLGAAIDGTATLVIPHVRGFERGRLDGESSVRRAVPQVARTIGTLMTRTGALQPFQAEVFTRIMLGQPEHMPLAGVDSGTLLSLEPLFERVVQQTAFLGLAGAPLQTVASQGILIGLYADTEGKTRREAAEIIAHNVSVAMGLRRRMFQGEPEVPDRDMTMALLKRLSKDKRLIEAVKERRYSGIKMLG